MFPLRVTCFDHLCPRAPSTSSEGSCRPLRSSISAQVPDPTFISLKPMEITFPPFDRQAHIRGDKRTAPSALTVDKYVSQEHNTGSSLRCNV